MGRTPGLFFTLGLILLLSMAPAGARAAIVVIGDASLPALDRTQLSRIYTGRTVQLAGISLQPLNLKAGDPSRASFLKAVLNKTDDEYVAYWIVRRSIGKGTPPRELENAQAVIDFVRATRGAIGYIQEEDLTPGVRVLLRLP